MEEVAPVIRHYYFQDRPPDGPLYHLLRTGDDARELFRDGLPIKDTFTEDFVADNSKCFRPLVLKVLEYLLQRAEQPLRRKEFALDPALSTISYEDINGYIGKLRTLLRDGTPLRILINPTSGYVRFNLPVTDHPADKGKKNNQRLSVKTDLLLTTRSDNASLALPDHVAGQADVSIEPTSAAVDQWVSQLRDQIRGDIEDRCSKIRTLSREKRYPLHERFADMFLLERRHVDSCSTTDEGVQLIAYNGFGLLVESSDRRIRLQDIFATTPRRVVLYGKPGSGKSTLLKYLAVECISGRYRPDLVPVLLPMRDFAESEATIDLWRSVHRQWGGSGTTRSLLHAGRAFVLLDGLDEISRKQFERVRKAIDDFVCEFPTCLIALTCRIGAFDYVFEKFDDYIVADLDSAQITDFVGRFFSPDQSIASRFLQCLQSNSSALALACSPLVLSLLCVVFEDLGEIGGSVRGDIYKEVVSLLLRRWDAIKAIRRDFPYSLTAKEIEALLSEVAYAAFAESKHLFSQDELERAIAQFIAERNPSLHESEIDAESVLRSIESNLGLLTKQVWRPRPTIPFGLSPDQLSQTPRRPYSFSHLAVQHYFAACKVANDSTSLRYALGRIGPINTDAREVWLHLVRLSDPDDLLLQVKRHVDAQIESFPKLQEFLAWCRIKAARTDNSHWEPALRALFFENIAVHGKLHRPDDDTDGGGSIAWRLEPDLFNDAVSLLRPPFSVAKNYNVFLGGGLIDSKLSVDLLLTSLLYKDRLALHPRILYTRGTMSPSPEAFARLQQEFEQVLAYLLKVAASAHDDLHAELISLIGMYPGVDLAINEEPREEERISAMKDHHSAWWKDLRKVAIRHCDVGRDWEFTFEESLALLFYHNAHALLIDCIRATQDLSDRTRHRLMGSMLFQLRDE